MKEQMKESDAWLRIAERLETSGLLVINEYYEEETVCGLCALVDDMVEKGELGRKVAKKVEKRIQKNLVEVKFRDFWGFWDDEPDEAADSQKPLMYKSYILDNCHTPGSRVLAAHLMYLISKEEGN